MDEDRICIEITDVVGDPIIKKHKDYFEIVFTNQYVCRISNYDEKYCIVEHKDGIAVYHNYFLSYEQLGVKNLDELFQLLVLKPNEMIEKVTENDIPISRFLIEYFDN